MARAGQVTVWTRSLTCPHCYYLFSTEKLPVNLSCGHTLCQCCLRRLNWDMSCCPIDQILIVTPYQRLPINVALMSILGIDIRDNPHARMNIDQQFFRVEAILVYMSRYLTRERGEQGDRVCSRHLSQSVQRKLLALLCFQMVEGEGRQRALITAKGLAQRILTEFLIAHQNNTSYTLWSALRAKKCHLLDPAVQDVVLRLILLTLSKGALIARKTLVMNIVQMLGEDYPQVSKRRVRHVVQLVCRAGCFNVIEQEGESSRMQLKSDFRHYDTLRRAHDTKIIQLAMEAGLRVSPDQWSAFLYADQSHTSPMQSIIDTLLTPEVFNQMIHDLRKILENRDPECLLPFISCFLRFDRFNATNNEFRSWEETVELLTCLSFILCAYVQFNTRRLILRGYVTH